MADSLEHALNLLELDAGKRSELRTQIEAARLQQARDLQDAMDSALRFLPRVLRGPIKALFAA